MLDSGDSTPRSTEQFPTASEEDMWPRTSKCLLSMAKAYKDSISKNVSTDCLSWSRLDFCTSSCGSCVGNQGSRAGGQPECQLSSHLKCSCFRSMYEVYDCTYQQQSPWNKHALRDATECLFTTTNRLLWNTNGYQREEKVQRFV